MEVAVMKTSREELFFYHTIQESIALYYDTPMRFINSIEDDRLFEYCKGINFLSLNYKDKESWLHSISKKLKSVPSFLNSDTQSYLKIVDQFQTPKVVELKKIYKLIFFTRSTSHPFFYKKLKGKKNIWTLSLLYAIYIALHTHLKKSFPTNNKFLDLTLIAKECNGMTLLIGPIMLEDIFKEEEKKIEYIKNLKNYFNLEQHGYELINLFNQNRTTSKSSLQTCITQILSSMKYLQHFDTNKEYPKERLRTLAAYCIYLHQHNRKKSKDINEKSFETFAKSDKANPFLIKFQNRRIHRELASLDWFNNLSFEHSTFQPDLNKFTTDAMNFLQNTLQADLYIFNQYFQYNKEFQLMEQSNLNPTYAKPTQKLLEKIKADKQSKKKSLSYQVVNKYYEDKNPLNLIGDLPQDNINQTFNNNPTIRSVLSIPLIFDKRVFAVIHFLGFSKDQFDKIDQRYLLKHSEIISRRYVDNIFDSKIEHITTLLSNLEKNIKNHTKLRKQLDEIGEDITKIFASDGLALWINQKAVYHTQEELNEIVLESDINFLDKDEEGNYSFIPNKKDTLLDNHKNQELISKSNIFTQTSDDLEDKNYMKYRQHFIKKGIKSFMIAPIKDYKGNLTGALLIFDRYFRDYNQTSKSMMKRITLHLGSILNTISFIKYRTQQNDEKILHESSQYINMIDSRAKDLERQLHAFNLPISYDKNRLFLNIEDIKDYTAYTKKFLQTLFQGGKFTKEYDQLLKKDILNIKRCKTFIPIKNILNQILITNSNKMHHQKNIIYENQTTHDIKVKIPKQEFHDVINNIINNAIKYGKINTYITLKDEITPYYYNLFIENIGYIIQKNEYDIIFKKGIRGKIIYELSQKEEEFKEQTSINKGIGLYYAKEITKAWDGNIKLERSEPLKNQNFAKNIFLIKIPINRIEGR